LSQEGTCLRHLNLNGNFIEGDTVAAMMSLLTSNRMLLSLSFENARCRGVHGAEAEHLVDGGELKQLTEALEHNTSLLRLKFKSTPGLDCSAVFTYLERNRKSFKVSTLQGGLRVVLNSSGQRFPNELVRYFSEEGTRYLSERDALNVSAVNKAAWNERQRLLQGLRA
jgi:hypothetical protein